MVGIVWQLSALLTVTASGACGTSKGTETGSAGTDIRKAAQVCVYVRPSFKNNFRTVFEE